MWKGSRRPRRSRPSLADDLPPGNHSDVRAARSGLAETLREAEASRPQLDSLEITTCLRRGDEMVTRYRADAAAVYAARTQLLRDAREQALLRRRWRNVDDQVARSLTGAGSRGGILYRGTMAAG